MQLAKLNKQKRWEYNFGVQGMKYTLWEHLCHCNVSLELSLLAHVPFIREYDQVVMEYSVQNLFWNQWQLFNKVGYSHNFYIATQLVLCHGCSVHAVVLLLDKPWNLWMTFSHEQQTLHDFSIPREMLCTLLLLNFGFCLLSTSFYSIPFTVTSGLLPQSGLLFSELTMVHSPLSMGS